MLTSISGTYGEPVPLGSTRLPWATMNAAVSDRGTIRLEQDGQRVFLTPEELRVLVALVDGVRA